MDVILDFLFKFSVLGAGLGLFAYVVLGKILAVKLRKQDNETWLSLGKPRGLFTITFHGTSLVDEYLDKGFHLSSANEEIRRIGSNILYAREIYNKCSWACIGIVIVIKLLENL